MNAAAIKTAGSYLLAWGAIVLSVILLTFLFTFLGTITCAVLIGMMLGAVKGPRWFSVSVSLVFPGVILGLVRSANVNLTQQQVLLLEALCFCAFWVTYLVSALVFFREQRATQSSLQAIPGPPRAALATAGQAAATDGAPASELAGCIMPRAASCLKQLQGDWVCAASSAGEPRHKRIIQIKAAKLELKAIDASGRMSLLARGELTLQDSRPSPSLVIAEVEDDPADFLVCP